MTLSGHCHCPKPVAHKGRQVEMLSYFAVKLFFFFSVFALDRHVCFRNQLLVCEKFVILLDDRIRYIEEGSACSNLFRSFVFKPHTLFMTRAKQCTVCFPLGSQFHCVCFFWGGGVNMCA